jgi:hypothetical protein
MYEHRSRPPLTRGAFFLRMLRHLLIAVAFVGLSLGAGMIGYLYFEHDHLKTWRDAFLNAGMLLGGMGPVHNPATDGGKLFAGLYALYAGLVFFGGGGIVINSNLSPVAPPLSLGQPAQNARPHRAASSGDSRAD